MTFVGRNVFGGSQEGGKKQPQTLVYTRRGHVVQASVDEHRLQGAQHPSCGTSLVEPRTFALFYAIRLQVSACDSYIWDLCRQNPTFMGDKKYSLLKVHPCVL